MKNWNRILVVAVPLILLGVLVYFFSDILAYVVLAWVLSMLGEPIMGFLSKFMNRNIAAALTLSSFTLLFLALFWLFLPPIVQQARNLAGVDYQEIGKSLEEPLEDWQDWLVDKGLLEGEEAIVDPVIVATATNTEKEPRLFTKVIHLDSLLNEEKDTSKIKESSNIAIVINIDQSDIQIEDNGNSDEIVKESDSFFERVKKGLYGFLNPSRIPQLFGTVVGFLGNLIVAIMSIFFIAFFFLREQGLFEKIISIFVPSGEDSKVGQAVDEASVMLIRYFVGVAVQVFVITIFVSGVLTFLGIKNALLIGFFAALMNVIPYVGPIIGASFGVIITVSSNLDVSFYNELLPMLLKVVGTFGAMQLLDNFILQPNIFSKSVKAHPLEIFIIILMGAKIGGIVGMVMAIPVYTVFRVVARVFLSKFQIVQKITKGLEAAD